MQTIDNERTLNIAYGACLLGSGGGGGLETARHLIDTELTHKDEVPLFTVDEVAEDRDKLTCVTLFAGSPSSGGKVSSEPAVNAVKEMNELCKARWNKEIGYLVPLEVGAVNTIIPILVAKKMGLGVVNADGAGRAVPELTHCTYSLVKDLSMNPTVMGARDGHTVTLKFVAYHRMKSILSIVLTTPPFGRIGGMAIWPIHARLLEDALPIRGTMDLCGQVGQALRGPEPSTRVANALAVLEKHGRHAVKLFQGTVHFEQGGTQMYDTGHARIENDGDTAHVFIQNENLIAWSAHHARVLGMMPDSLCYVTQEGTPMSNAAADSADGKDVFLIGVAADKVLLEPQLLEAYRGTLLRAGYAGPYMPLPD